MSAQGNDLSGKWPSWAPKELTGQHDRLLSVFTCAGFDFETEFQREYVATLRLLCTNDEMSRVWPEIARHAKQSDYHVSLAEQATAARLAHPICPGMSAEELRNARTQAATAARRLRGLLTQMGFDQQSVFPILGAKAMSGAINHFLDGTHLSLSDDPQVWKQELTTLGGVMMKNSPGVGSIGDLLERLAERLESKDKELWPPYRKDDEGARARHLCIVVGNFVSDLCGTPLYGTVTTICGVFFPGVLQKDSVRSILLANAKQPVK